MPLNLRESFADLAVALQCQVVLVGGVKLGCINHALLTAEAIARDGLQMVGWVANIIDPNTARLAENLASLDALLGAPSWGGVEYLREPTALAVAAQLNSEAMVESC
mgnify:FL=1